MLKDAFRSSWGQSKPKASKQDLSVSRTSRLQEQAYTEVARGPEEGLGRVHWALTPPWDAPQLLWLPFQLGWVSDLITAH